MKYFAFLLSIFLAFLAGVSPAAEAKAVSGFYTTHQAVAGFNAGNIISDANFYNGYALNEWDVQAVLNARVPTCTIGQPGRTPGTPLSGTYVASACLKDYFTASRSIDSNANCAAYSGSGSESAAQIIARVGQACGISQKVLLVMLEKEQSLISDTWPDLRQYNVAMGYGCPDTGPNYAANCAERYFGFFNQVYMAAWQLKQYKTAALFFKFQAGSTVNIQWHPNVNCGSSPVYIANAATAALYNYTPYQPNTAALAVGFGVGDSCSSYGNRNFYALYKAWFGSPNGSGNSIYAGDIVARDAAGALWNYGNLYTGYNGHRQIGSGWQTFTSINSVDFNADGVLDIVAPNLNGQLYLYLGSAAGGFSNAIVIGSSGWAGADVHVARASRSSVYPTVFARFADGSFYRYDWQTIYGPVTARQIGIGWQGFTAISAGYFDSDANLDFVAQTTDGNQLLYRTDGSNFKAEQPRIVGVGWSGMETTLQANMHGAGSTGHIAKNLNGLLYYYPHSSSGVGWFTGSRLIGNGWQTFTLVRGSL